MWFVHKENRRNGGRTEVGQYINPTDAEATAEYLKRRDQSGDHSYTVTEVEMGIDSGNDVQELSKEKLDAYEKKAKDDIMRRARPSRAGNKANQRKIMNRQRGIVRKMEGE